MGLDFIHEDKMAGIGDTDDNKRDFMTLEKKASQERQDAQNIEILKFILREG